MALTRQRASTASFSGAAVVRIAQWLGRFVVHLTALERSFALRKLTAPNLT
ncbi:MAG: hypothetical protein RBJ76_01950 [Stenomitos frigidus ULC029]